MTAKKTNKIYGLVGRDISYSFSESYFNNKFHKESISDSIYKTFDLTKITKISEVFEILNLKGLNITVPYKEQIINFLDELDETAKSIGAVNCIKVQNGIKIGYNTDAYGFENSIKPLLEPQHQKALILGDGGAAKAVKFVLDKLNIDFKTVKRKGSFKFSDLTNEIIKSHQIIINTTPLGTFPDTDKLPPIPVEFIDSTHLVYDLIYNPSKTKLLELAERNGAKIKNGYEMLILQAEKSWEIWNQPL